MPHEDARDGSGDQALGEEFGFLGVEERPGFGSLSLVNGFELESIDD